MIAIDFRRPLSELLQEHSACTAGMKWAEIYTTASAAWLACDNPRWMLWALEQIGYQDEKLRLFACWCVRYTPLGDGRTTWDLLIREQSRKAIEVAERFARWQATRDELFTAYATAGAAADVTWDSVRDAAWDAAYAATEAARDATYATVWDAAWAAAGAAARAACAASTDAAWDTARAAARSAQAKALREIIGNPFADIGSD
jgi:hypothetical protein